MIRFGGHTGNTVLGTVDDSELLRRVTAADPDYRMPKEGPPLPAQDVTLLRRWIEQGAPWPDNESASPGAALESQVLTIIPGSSEPPFGRTTNDSWASWLSDQLDVISEYQQPMRPLLIAILPICLVILGIERRKKRVRNEDTAATEPVSSRDDWSQRVTFVHYGIVAMIFFWVATVIFYGVQHSRLRRANEELTEKWNRRGGWAETQNRLPKPVGPFRPKHPPRMGGTYYRGNDERNEKLFNGGFYATSKMFLSVRDRSNDALTWDDPVDRESLSVCLEIKRSPYATPSLFNDHSMVQCSLRTASDPDDPGKNIQQADLQIVEPGERWRACFPLRGLGEKEGDVLRYNGGIDLCNAGGQPHYGIRYDILLRDGRIDAESEIWMGATFLTSNVVVPPQNKITLREWFDFVAIPEITEENTKDPELLGITEHLHGGDQATHDGTGHP